MRVLNYLFILVLFSTSIFAVCNVNLDTNTVASSYDLGQELTYNAVLDDGSSPVIGASCYATLYNSDGVLVSKYDTTTGAAGIVSIMDVLDERNLVKEQNYTTTLYCQSGVDSCSNSTTVVLNNDFRQNINLDNSIPYIVFIALFVLGLIYTITRLDRNKHEYMIYFLYLTILVTIIINFFMLVKILELSGIPIFLQFSGVYLWFFGIFTTFIIIYAVYFAYQQSMEG